ncbi:MAG: metal-dependent hydrolase [Polyangiaceae bacterium]|nr:metal-dependent hydrolase [Polyangiaceae bacterium]MCW5792622.1 metal-dependent hydrolase [Polyangiaceae bacterium]
MSQTETAPAETTKWPPKARNRKATRAPNPPLLRRDLNLQLDPDAIPRVWYRGSPQLTALMNGLSLLFPKGEQFFVASVRRYRNKLTDPELRAQVEGFIAQEAMHGKEHRAFNRLLEAHGHRLAPKLEREVAALLKLASRRLPHQVQLAVTCALEHFTAILAEQLLSDESHHSAVHEGIRPLWLWHALEESEHRAVAFDVYEAIGGGYVVRAATMVGTTLIFFAVATGNQLRLLRASGELYQVKSWARAMNIMWFSPGLFRQLIVPYLEYFRPDFHPAKRDTQGLLATWEQRLFGEGGLLANATITQVS